VRSETVEKTHSLLAFKGVEKVYLFNTAQKGAIFRARGPRERKTRKKSQKNGQFFVFICNISASVVLLYTNRMIVKRHAFSIFNVENVRLFNF
jgi:hypothetical protein